MHMSITACMIDYLERMCPESRDVFNVWEISDNISELMQDKDIVAMKD